MKLTFWCNLRRKKLHSNFMQKHPQLKNKQANKSKKYKSNFLRFELFEHLMKKRVFSKLNFFLSS